MVQTLSSSFVERTRAIRDRIDSALAAYADFDGGCPARLREAIRYSLLAPGKRLRPLLTWLAAEACGGSPEAALPAACAVEMIHAYSLIHDDLPAMDDDDLRRGRPTNHKVYGEALAILAGDALLSLAFEVLARHVQPPAVAAACCATLAGAAGPEALVGGQADDLSTAGCQGDCRMLESIHHRKTGALIRASLRMGGLVAGAEAPILAALDGYGQRLGLAFQIVDDLLDVRGDEQTVGKRVGKDSACGKLTFPGVLGADQSARRADEATAEAIAALAPLGALASDLESLARYVLERNR